MLKLFDVLSRWGEAVYKTDCERYIALANPVGAWVVDDTNKTK